MAAQYLPLLFVIAVALLAGLIAIGLGYLFGPRRPTRKKSQIYESGVVPYGPGRRRISVRYYLIAVLFILFDIELVFFMPWAVVFRKLGRAGLAGMLVFMGILAIGYIYAWKKGALEWE